MAGAKKKDRSLNLKFLPKNLRNTEFLVNQLNNAVGLDSEVYPNKGIDSFLRSTDYKNAAEIVSSKNKTVKQVQKESPRKSKTPIHMPPKRVSYFHSAK